MGTGLIFAAIVVAWLAYLVPLYLRRQQVDEADSDPRESFPTSARIIATGAAPLLDQDGAAIGDVEVSTPMTRRSAIRRIRQAEREAAARRRRVLLVLLTAVAVCLGLATAGLVPWWSLAVPGGLVVLFLGVARFTVAAMIRSHDEQVAAIRQGSDDEATVVIRVARSRGEQEASPATRPVAGLWDPIPVTTPTYVSKPLAPRTVRTIDLSAPDVTSSGRRDEPVLAETAPVVVDAPAERPRAVGE
ncbi:hypothetical protein GC722_11355 [Auraticoccus sp. F435]|uniref:Uncharacterized protein n=1 Tax=Auraticoccus cholistanensis TaxID=2656650 RepID=A0A6A9UXW1_9ACTN|nr:hypothetical protein [Auraticoccus cholistanensis]MVA76615.1 hypothetical protein [Auraticoccus cholistanensis]